MRTIAAILLALATAGASRGWGETPVFRMVILNDTWFSLGLGYGYDTAWAKLSAVPLDAPLFTLTAAGVASYDPGRGGLTLTPDAARRLHGALATAARREPGSQAVMSLTQSLGWGNELCRALHTRIFVVLIGEERVYGGVFLDSASQMRIRYPVARCVGEGAVVGVRMLPIQIPFFDADPGVGSSARAQQLLTIDHGSLQREVPPSMLEAFRQDARSPEARAMRALIRDERILTALAEARAPKD